LRIPSSDVSTYTQIFVHRDYEVSVGGNPQVIVDAGANIGLAAIWFANRHPQARIFAIEPEAGNFELLVKNAAPYANITCIQAALWERNEPIRIVDPGLGEWGFQTEGNATENPLRETVGAVTGLTVDELMRQYGMDSIDILKVDIEGAEREVFRDTSAWIGRVRSLIVELHEHLKPGCNRNYFCGTPGFDTEWYQGENIFLSRGAYLHKGPASVA
jgi:FkbM family methyltransferase